MPQMPFGNDPQSTNTSSGASSSGTPQDGSAQPSYGSVPSVSDQTDQTYGAHPTDGQSYGQSAPAYGAYADPAQQSYGTAHAQPNPFEQTAQGAAGAGAAAGSYTYQSASDQPQQGQPQGQPYPPQGAYYGYGYPYPIPANQRWNTLCVIGFVLSFLFAPAGLVLSVIALIQINKSGEKSKGLSIAGIIVSVINTIMLVLCIVAFAWLFETSMNMVHDGSLNLEPGSGSSSDCAVTINGECLSYGDLRRYGIDPDDLDDLQGLSGLGLDFGSGNGQTTAWVEPTSAQ